MMLGLVSQLGPERLVFQHAIEKRPRRVHAAAFRGKDPLREQAECLGVALEPAVPAHQVVERALARMAERRVPEIVRKADRLDQVRIDEEIISQRPVGAAFQPVGNRFANLRDFQRVRQPCPIEIILAAPEDLGLVLQAPESRSVQHPVPVDLERRPIVRAIARARAPLRVESPVEAVQHLSETRCPRLSGNLNLRTTSREFRHPTRRWSGRKLLHNSFGNRRCSPGRSSRVFSAGGTVIFQDASK